MRSYQANCDLEIGLIEGFEARLAIACPRHEGQRPALR